MSYLNGLAMDVAERGVIPDAIIRRGIVSLLKQRLQQICADDVERSAELTHHLVRQMWTSPLALVPEKANEQHYEVPARFFETVLGARLKYSSCYWDGQVSDLNSAEERSLQITCEHAQLCDGQRVLELGCGWGSLTLWMAEHYPGSHITAVSNSHSQAEFILAQARQRGLLNIEVITCDMNEFEFEENSLDRVVSIEMFEHMRNYPLLYRKISQWMKPDGLFFKHIFTHCRAPYEFRDEGVGDWMSRYFFSGGIMPSNDLPLYFQDHLALRNQWVWDGTHYQKTADAWLENMDANRDQVWPEFQRIYGKDFAKKWWSRWRMFFMACSELFGYRNGQQWMVSHYLFENRRGD